MRFSRIIAARLLRRNWLGLFVTAVIGGALLVGAFSCEPLLRAWRGEDRSLYAGETRAWGPAQYDAAVAVASHLGRPRTLMCDALATGEDGQIVRVRAVDLSDSVARKSVVTSRTSLAADAGLASSTVKAREGGVSLALSAPSSGDLRVQFAGSASNPSRLNEPLVVVPLEIAGPTWTCLIPIEETADGSDLGAVGAAASSIGIAPSFVRSLDVQSGVSRYLPFAASLAILLAVMSSMVLMSGTASLDAQVRSVYRTAHLLGERQPTLGLSARVRVIGWGVMVAIGLLGSRFVLLPIASRYLGQAQMVAPPTVGFATSGLLAVALSSAASLGIVARLNRRAKAWPFRVSAGLGGLGMATAGLAAAIFVAGRDVASASTLAVPAMIAATTLAALWVWIAGRHLRFVPGRPALLPITGAGRAHSAVLGTLFAVSLCLGVVGAGLDLAVARLTHMERYPSSPRNTVAMTGRVGWLGLPTSEFSPSTAISADQQARMAARSGTEAVDLHRCLGPGGGMLGALDDFAATFDTVELTAGDTSEQSWGTVALPIYVATTELQKLLGVELPTDRSSGLELFTGVGQITSINIRVGDFTGEVPPFRQVSVPSLKWTEAPGVLVSESDAKTYCTSPVVGSIFRAGSASSAARLRNDAVAQGFVVSGAPIAPRRMFAMALAAGAFAIFAPFLGGLVLVHRRQRERSRVLGLQGFDTGAERRYTALEYGVLLLSALPFVMAVALVPWFLRRREPTLVEWTGVPVFVSAAAGVLSLVLIAIGVRWCQRRDPDDSL